MSHVTCASPPSSTVLRAPTSSSLTLGHLPVESLIHVASCFASRTYFYVTLNGIMEPFAKVSHRSCNQVSVRASLKSQLSCIPTMVDSEKKVLGKEGSKRFQARIAIGEKRKDYRRIPYEGSFHCICNINDLCWSTAAARFNWEENVRFTLSLFLLGMNNCHLNQLPSQPSEEGCHLINIL